MFYSLKEKNPASSEIPMSPSGGQLPGFGNKGSYGFPMLSSSPLQVSKLPRLNLT